MVHGIGIAMLVALAVVSGHGVASAAAEPPCLPGEPDSVQISWDAPCESDAWLMDTELGCRMWDWHPDKEDKPSWTGACRNGLKEGPGSAQWFEDSQAIDRFAGTYHLDRRQGFGLYVWNDENWYEGNYDNDRPNGAGIAHVAGEVFSGQWKDGCLKKGDRVVAIGVQRSSCADPGNAKLSDAVRR